LAGAWREGSLAVDADLLEELGAESFVYAKGEPAAKWKSRSGRVVVRLDRKTSILPGERIHLLPNQDEVYFFSAETGARL
jgi:sn-glycerol 3-phosphate transport system ATP-binding protein